MSKCVGMLTGDGWTTKIDYMRRVYSIDDVCPTIATVTGGGMELKILVKQPSNGRDYYLPICGGGASTQHSRHPSREEDECRKEGRSAQRL